ncbi:MAG: AAA family ATPase, partial [Treponema sp.]|nr:AAA family ATPase [Treponema sp.]
MNPRKLPIGIQDFEKLRRMGYVYVDKTAYVYRLASEANPCFLSRPRRFGKSLLLATFKAYFQGKQELFQEAEGRPRLALADLEKDWVEYPVFHIDLNVEKYDSPAALESAFGANLRPLEERWGRNPGEETPSVRFLGLIQRAAEKTGRKVAVLIDEYDKPLLETMDNPELNEEIRRSLKAFYGTLKTADPWLRFAFLTGVTKFSQVSVFSDLNQLRDISLDRDYAGICGITDGELAGNFEPELRILAEDNRMSYEEALAETRKRYNGYHFARDSEGVFNPFSILNTLISREFRYYWFQTGTPAFLIKLLQKADFDIRDFAGKITIDPESIGDCRIQGGSPVPILYQSGYLTITGYDRETNLFSLGFPNEEVEYGFLNALLPYYGPEPAKQDFYIGKFFADLRSGDTEGFMTRLRAFFSSIPYELHDRTERYYQTVFFLVFRLLGQFAEAEA